MNERSRMSWILSVILISFATLSLAQPRPALEPLIRSLAGTQTYGEVAISPDGTRVAWSQAVHDSSGVATGDSAIYVADVASPAARRRITAGSEGNNYAERDVAWSPDGKQLAFVSDRLGKPQIFIMTPDGQNLRRLTTNGAYNVSPRWSPNGDRIVYARQTAEGFQIFAINPDGSGDAQLTFAGSNEHPRWSPDGRFITFSSNRSGKSAIYVMRADGSGQTEVMRGTSNNTHPAWSP